MTPESEHNLRLKIGHVLFIDIVGYSKLLIEEQTERLNQLTEIVLGTAQVREASEEQLVRLPTGDGMALVFRPLGKKELALEEGKRAMLLPVGKDATSGQAMQIYFAIIAAWVGEKDLALQYLALAGSTPGAANVANYGALKLDPFWDPLRGDPGFEKIVASLAPKDATFNR